MDDDIFKNESCQFVWGIKSWDDLTKAPACLYTMNDIDIDKEIEEEI